MHGPSVLIPVYIYIYYTHIYHVYIYIVLYHNIVHILIFHIHMYVYIPNFSSNDLHLWPPPTRFFLFVFASMFDGGSGKNSTRFRNPRPWGLTITMVVTPRKRNECHLKINGSKRCTLLGTNISHLGKRKIISKMPFFGDMLVPWRVFLIESWSVSFRGRVRFRGVLCDVEIEQ